MPMEMRKLAFTQDELQAALVNYALRSEIKLPNANIEKIRVKEEDDEKKTTSVTLVYPASESGNDLRSVEFSEAQIGAAIILYCKNLSIPLPRNARKTLSAENESVAIIMSVDWDKVEK